MLIEQPHFVHPADVALAGTMRTPDADPGQATHPDYVAIQRAWLEQYLIGEYNRATREEPGRWTSHDAPQIRDLTEPYTDTKGKVWQLPHEAGGVTYEVGWIGTLTVHQHPDWTEGP